MLRRIAEEKLEAAEKELNEADLEGIDELTTEMVSAEDDLSKSGGAITELTCFSKPPPMCIDVMQMIY
jgi:hypothetical protein